MPVRVGEIRLMWIPKFSRHYADYPVRNTVQTQCACQDIRASPQHGLPKLMTDDGNLRIPRLFILCVEAAPKLGSHFESSEKIGVYPCRAYPLSTIAPGKAIGRLVEPCHHRK